MEDYSGVYIFEENSKSKGEDTLTKACGQETIMQESSKPLNLTRKDTQSCSEEGQSCQEDQYCESGQSGIVEHNRQSSVRREYHAKKACESIQYSQRNKTDFYTVEKVHGQGIERLVMNVTDSTQFILNPIHPNLCLQCTILKVKQGVLGYSWHVFTQGRLLLTAQKKLGIATKFKMYSGNLTSQKNYIGKVESNFLGTEWQFFDSGVNPERSRDLEKVRKQLGSVGYQYNLLGRNGPRRMEVYLPTPERMKSNQFRCLESKSVLEPLYQKSTGMVSRFTNKQPEFDEAKQVYKLDFGGKIKVASTKNFIMVGQQCYDQCLLFGKIDEQSFYMELQYPLSPIQAVCVCISSADRKLGVE